MDKVKDITELLTFKKALYILDTLQIDYDYYAIKSRPDIYKEIVVLFEDNLDNLSVIRNCGTE